jgi:protease IV
MEATGRTRSPLRTLATLLLVIVVPLALGLFLAPRLVPKPKIGIVRLSYDIFAESTFEITEQLATARNDDSIKAVVLIINSPGGSAAYSEELYLDVLNTRDQMPVVATVDLVAASGAYYMAAAANEIYAKPTSAVGSIGVISLLSDLVFIEEDVLTTGPYKAFGGTRDGSVRQIEMAKHAFLRAVEEGRGDRLNTDLSFLSRAEIFTGVQAQQLGLIDGLLSNDEVIGRAAELAGLRSPGRWGQGYEVVELYPLTFETSGGAEAYHPAPIDPTRLWAAPNNLPAGMYFRYIELPSSR